MSNQGPASPPPPPGGIGTPPPPPPPPPPAGGRPPADRPQPGGPGPWQSTGVAPRTLDEVYYKPGLMVLLYIVTLGIFGAIWTYRTKEDLKKYNGDGLGGVLGVVIYILLAVVIMFTIPNEIKNMYERDGRQSPVRAVHGLWFLLPIVGMFIWYFKVQRSLNDFWTSKGVPGPA